MLEGLLATASLRLYSAATVLSTRASMYAPPARLATNVWGAFHLWGYDGLCFIVTIQHLNHTCIGIGNRHIRALLVVAQLVVKIQAAIHSPYVS